MPEENKKADPTENSSVSIFSLFFDMLGTMLMAVFILLLLMAFIFRQYTVDGDSMNDTLYNNERLIVHCLNYEPVCGDIVIISHGARIEDLLVKRVIATGGQSIDIDPITGEVTVDGVLLREDYVKGVTRFSIDPAMIPAVVPEGYVFVMGDNRENSMDSRSSGVGLIPVENIIGKAVLRWFPLDTFGFL